MQDIETRIHALAVGSGGRWTRHLRDTYALRGGDSLADPSGQELEEPR